MAVEIPGAVHVASKATSGFPPRASSTFLAVSLRSLPANTGIHSPTFPANFSFSSEISEQKLRQHWLVYVFPSF